MMQCDPVTGACLLPKRNDEAHSSQLSQHPGWAVRYIGDPMCSWCWGISPTVRRLAEFCDARGLAFSLHVGGLRAGGGDPWNDAFKAFLRNEWRHIAEVTGQPFGFTLLDSSHFDYDTEPACRAVVAIQMLSGQLSLPKSTVLDFFAAIQRKFYVDGQDPKPDRFYQSIFDQTGLPFDTFQQSFASVDVRQATDDEFARCRQWGMRSFPTLLIERDGAISTLATGYVTPDALLARLSSHNGDAEEPGQVNP
ncbi:DsbA family protein [Burkholderia cepacia]|uniref:DsbA family protein n=1 Tax=Burkholderia cepacia TaxID=292 RepID=UPI00075868EC|nr:DsbA family protein [Burkholderia cepacia]KVS65469.1 protein-disulfide isomerase [Burkholderia cepacia]